MRQIVLFGIRSPLAVEYEETCRRTGIAVPFAVSVDGAPRLATTTIIRKLDEIEHNHLKVACISCAFSPVRRRILVAAALEARFTIAAALVDVAAIVAGSTHIGAGSYINAGCVMGAYSLIGEHVVLNRCSSVGHHGALANYVSIGPGVTLAGNVRIGEGSVIGAGSTVLPDLRVGAGAIVAAGSVVRSHVPDGVFVAGNPAVSRPYNFDKSSLNLPDAE